MAKARDDVPKPKGKLWRTRFRWARNARKFARSIPFDTVVTALPDEAELSHWGEWHLLNDIVIVVHRDGTATRTMRQVVQLYSSESLSQWDEVVHESDRREAKESNREAKVYLPDGTSRKAKKEISVFNNYFSVSRVSFFPLRPGVIIDYESQWDFFKPTMLGPGWWDQIFFQQVMPCDRFRLTVAVAEPFEMGMVLHHGVAAPRETQSGSHTIYQWEMTNIPGVEADQWTPNFRDFVPWVDFSTFHNWKPVFRQYREELKPPKSMPKSARELTNELVADAPTDRDKVFRIYEYAARGMRYGRHPGELWENAPRKYDQMLQDLRGDCKDKSSLMVSMLKELKIPAEMVVLLTRANGKTPYLPSRRFDHAIVRAEVDGEELWFDPAAGLFTFGEIPQSDQGTIAIMLDSDEMELSTIPLPDSESHKTERTCTGQIDTAGNYRVKIEITATGEDACGLRAQYFDRTPEHRERMLAQMVAVNMTSAEVTNVEFHSLDDLDRDVSYSFELTLKEWGRRIEKLFLFRIPWFDSFQTQGPMSASKRVQPLQAWGVYSTYEHHEIELPPGFNGYGLPYHTEAECPWGRYSRSITQTGRLIICKRMVQYLGGIVMPEEFQEFKNFWEICKKSDDADVVLMAEAAMMSPGESKR